MYVFVYLFVPSRNILHSGVYSWVRTQRTQENGGTFNLKSNILISDKEYESFKVGRCVRMESLEV